MFVAQLLPAVLSIVISVDAVYDEKQNLIEDGTLV
jgi:hypothetical protein